MHYFYTTIPEVLTMAQIIPFEGQVPQIDPTAYVAESAVIIGKVTIGAGANIWPNAVLRGDSDSITIGKNVSIQDNSTVHTEPGQPVYIGDDVLIGHNTIIHCRTIEKGCLIGMGAILMNEVTIGEESIIGAGTMITQNKTIPPRSLVYGTPFRVVRELTKEEAEDVYHQTAHYSELGQIYKRDQDRK